MAIPKNKEELIEALTTSYNKLYLELKEIPENLSRKKTVEEGLCICDVIAYQIGWGNLLLSWYEAGKVNRVPSMPKEGFKWNELGKLAASFYTQYRLYTMKELLKEFDNVFERILKIVRKEDNDSLYKIGAYCWTGEKWPLGRWINVNTSSPYKSARAKIRKWKRSEGLI